MSVGTSIRRGAAWLFIGNTSSQILAFGFGIVLARLLAPADFGMLATIQVFTGLASFIAGGGMGQALVRGKEISKEDYDIVFTLQLIIGCLIYTIFFTTAPWFADWYHTPLYADLMRVSALTFVIRPFFGLPKVILVREMRFKALAIVSLISLVSSNAVAIALAALHFGVWSLTLSGIVGALVGIPTMVWLTGWRPGLSLDLKRGQSLARYGFMVSVNDVVVYFRQQASVFVMSRTLGPKPVGLLNKADSLGNIPFISISGAVYDPIFRAIARSADNPGQVKCLYLRALTLISIYTYPFYALLIFSSNEIIRTLYGDRWQDAATPVSILAIAGLFKCIGHPGGAVLGAMNKLGRELVVQIVSLFTLAFALAIGIHFGLLGVAWALVFAHILAALHISYVTGKVLGITLLEILKAILPALVQFLTISGTLGLMKVLLTYHHIHEILELMIYVFWTGVTFLLTAVFFPFRELRQEVEKVLGAVRANLLINRSSG